MKMKKWLLLLLLTPIFLILSHNLVVMMHEYAHSMVAWLLGYKSSPLDLDYGATSLLNILFLVDVNQAVDSRHIFSLGRSNDVGMIASAGLVIDFMVFVLTYWLLKKSKMLSRPYLSYFIFFCNLMALGNIYAYIPMRNFTPSGEMIDIIDMQAAWGISPWWFYAVGSYLVAYLFYKTFTCMLIRMYRLLNLDTIATRASLMTLTVLLLFGYFGMAGFLDHGELSHLLSFTSLIMIPGVMLCLWPSRKWVRDSVECLG